MGKSFLFKGITLGIISVLLFFSLSFASEEGSIRLQGRVMQISLDNRMMMVNEGLFFWDEKTIINNHKGSPITPEMLKKNSYVYIEAENSKAIKGLRIRKIYLLPKYIDNKGRSRYPFMQ